MFWWVAQTTLIAGALAVLATLASRWKRLGPEIRHALWLVVLIKLALPPVVAWPWRVPDRWPSTAEPPVVVVARVETPPVPVASPVAAPVPDPTPAPEPVPPQPTELATVEPLPAPPVEVEPPLPSEIPPASSEDRIAVVPPVVESPMPEVPSLEPAPPPDVTSELEAVAPPVEAVAPPPVIAAPQPEVRHQVFEIWHLQLLLGGLWVAGSLVAVIRRAIKVVQFQRSLSDTTPAPGWLLDETQAIGDRLSVRPPPVVLASQVGTPLLWCLGRPRLILPEALVKRLEADRWAGILAHELAHLARRDHWVVRLELLIEAAWWWNPLFWHVRRKLHEEAELACDERVVRSLPERRYAYAEALVDVCEHLARTAIPSPALGVGGAGASHSLEGRLLMILRDPIPRRPSRAASLVALLLAALALPAWTLGQQKPDDPAPKAEAEALTKPTTPETPASKLDEPRPADATPQAITPVANPSADASKATTTSIKTALDQRAEQLKHLSFRYVVASRELRRYRTQANGGMVGMGGMEPVNGMGGMGGGGMGGGGGGFRSMPPQFGGMMPQGVPGGSANNLESPQPVENRVQIEVADVVLDSARASRLDVLEAWPAPANDVKPPIDFRWVRRFVAVGSGITTLRMAWDMRGPVPFRWLANSSIAGVGDSLLAWMSGGQASTSPDRGLDPLDPRPANMLGLIGSSLGFVDPDLTRAEVAGIDMVDGQEAIRVAWIGANGVGIRGIVWYAPKLGFAPIRFEATLDPVFHGRYTWRMKASDFAKVGDYWLPGKVSFEESEAHLEAGGEPYYRRELRIAFEDFNADQKAAANAPAKLTIQGLDDRTGQFTALPPEVPASLVERLKKAVADSPFGPPAPGRDTQWGASGPGILPSAVDAQPVPQGGQPRSAQQAPGQPQQVNPQSGQKPGLAQPSPQPAPRFSTNPNQRPAMTLPNPAEKDPAQADPGIIVQPKPGFEDPIPVIKPETNDPITKPPGDRAEIDRRLEDRLKAEPEARDLAAKITAAQAKLKQASQISRNGNDPAVTAARKKLEALNEQYAQFKELKSQDLLNSVTQEFTQARDSVDLLAIRRDRKVAELQKAEAQRNTAKATADRFAALQRRGNVNNAEAKIKADGELAVAEAGVAAAKTELAEADLILKQAKERLEPGKTPTAEAGDSKPLETLRDWAIADLEKAKAQFKQAKDIVASNEKLNQMDVFDREQAKVRLLITEFEVSKKQAALVEIERRIVARDAVQTDLKQPAEPKPAPTQGSTTVDPDRIAILQARRDGKAAEVQKAQAQKKVAMTVVARNEALVKKDENYVSKEDRAKAEGELAIADAEVASKTAELAEAEALLAQAKRGGTTATVAPKSVEDSGPRSASTLAELRDAVELLEVQLQGKQSLARTAATHPDRAKWQSEVDEYQVRIKQARRRVEAEEARLKREIERAKEDFDRAETLNKKGIIGPHEAYVARARLDELMIQLDPSYVPPKPPAEPREGEKDLLKSDIERARDRLLWSEDMFKKGFVSAATLQADRLTYDGLMHQLDPSYVPPTRPVAEPQSTVNALPVLEVKITGEKTRFTGQTNQYKLIVKNIGTGPAKKVQVVASLPQQGGKLIALPPGARLDTQTRKLLWSIPQLEPDQTQEFTFNYGTSTPGLYRASVEVASADVRATDTLLTDVSGIAAFDLQITQTARVVDVGKSFQYDITIKNVGSKEATKLSLTGKLRRNLKVLKALNLEGGELAFQRETGEFLFPMIERLGPGQTITRSLEVQATEAGSAGCHVYLRHAEMAKDADLLEDVVSTTVTKPDPPANEPKK